MTLGEREADDVRRFLGAQTAAGLAASAGDENLSVFDDGPAIGIGSDGNVHDDPYCAAIAPMGSPEARHGELCGKCEERRSLSPADAHLQAPSGLECSEIVCIQDDGGGDPLASNRTYQDPQARENENPTTADMLAAIREETTSHFRLTVRREHAGWDNAQFAVHGLEGREAQGFWSNTQGITYGKTLEDTYARITLTDDEIAELYRMVLARREQRAIDAAKGGSGLRTGRRR